MIKRYIHGSCDFTAVEEYDDVEKAAKGQGGSLVECKVKNIKVDFTKVRREDDESQTGTPKTKGQGAKKV